MTSELVRPYLNKIENLFSVVLYQIEVTMSTKRQRKSNYPQEENLFLADKHEEFKDVTDAKHKDEISNRKNGGDMGIRASATSSKILSCGEDYG